MNVLKMCFVLLALWSGASRAQQGASEPFILQGCIRHAEGFGVLSFLGPKNEPLTDTVRFDPAGRFYLRTDKVRVPQRIRCSGKLDLGDLFVAPGYELTLMAESTANGVQHKRLTGRGAAPNRYLLLLDSIRRATETKSWIDMPEDAFLEDVQRLRRLKDSLAGIVFDTPEPDDPFHAVFGAMTRIDNRFYPLYQLTAWSDFNLSDPARAAAFVQARFDSSLLLDLYRDDYLLSTDYRKWILTGGWLDYLLRMEYARDQRLRARDGYPLELIARTYRGKARAYALQDRIGYAIRHAGSLDRLVAIRRWMGTYSAALDSFQYRQQLAAQLAERHAALLRAQSGKPAPSFVAYGAGGKAVRLDDFKGKVLYLDLWASWCGPCRDEVPAFRSLYRKFRNDPRVAFVSISVLDRRADWHKALAADKPQWLQLFDTDGTVERDYFVTNLPQFLLIDKKGRIVTFQAPRPGSGKELEDLLRKELKK